MKSVIVRLLMIAAIITSLSSLGLSAVWYVDDDNCPGPGTGTALDPYCKIQDAISAASSGDVVLVACGYYVENIDFMGKAIWVRSDMDGVVATVDLCLHETIIDGNQQGSVVKFVSGEVRDSILEGFTIRNGTGTPLDSLPIGGGIICNGTSPTIRRNIITENTLLFNASGGGIAIANHADALVQDNIISWNTAGELEESGGGGGISVINQSGPEIRNNLIIGNLAGIRGGGLAIDNSSNPLIENCTFSLNVTGPPGHHWGGGAIFKSVTSSMTVKNCICWGDTLPELLLGGKGRGPSSVTYTCVEGGWGGTGNIDDDPLFVRGPLGDYYLSQVDSGQIAQSRCVEEGNPGSQEFPGATRTDHVQDAHPVDMGYHYPLEHPMEIGFDLHPEALDEMPSGTRVDDLWAHWGVSISAHSRNNPDNEGVFTGRPDDHPHVDDCIPVSEPNCIKTCEGPEDPTSDAGIFTFHFETAGSREALTAKYVSLWFLDVEEPNQGPLPNDSRLEAYDVNDTLLATVFVPLGENGQQFLAEITQPGIHYVKAYVGQADPGGDSGALDHFSFLPERIPPKELGVKNAGGVFGGCSRETFGTVPSRVK